MNPIFHSSECVTYGQGSKQQTIRKWQTTNTNITHGRTYSIVGLMPALYDFISCVMLCGESSNLLLRLRFILGIHEFWLWLGYRLWLWFWLRSWILPSLHVVDRVSPPRSTHLASIISTLHVAFLFRRLSVGTHFITTEAPSTELQTKVSVALAKDGAVFDRAHVGVVFASEIARPLVNEASHKAFAFLHRSDLKYGVLPQTATFFRWISNAVHVASHVVKFPVAVILAITTEAPRPELQTKVLESGANSVTRSCGADRGHCFAIQCPGASVSVAAKVSGLSLASRHEEAHRND